MQGKSRPPYGAVLSGSKCEFVEGYNFNGHTRTARGKKYRYYEDAGFNLHGSSTCLQSLIRADDIEDFIMKAVSERMHRVVDRTRQVGENGLTLSYAPAA